MDMTRFEVRRITQKSTECRHKLILNKSVCEHGGHWCVAWELYQFEGENRFIHGASGDQMHLEGAIKINKTTPVEVVELDGKTTSLDVFLLEHPDYQAYMNELEDKLNGR